MVLNIVLFSIPMVLIFASERDNYKIPMIALPEVFTKILQSFNV
jgi:hypothetical protein